MLSRGHVIVRNIPLTHQRVFINGGIQRRTFMISTAHKWIEACLRFHPIDLFWKIYNNGDVKFGKHVGTDRFGTKYYEDPLEVHGQQRYAEFQPGFHVNDASQIPPEWHAWLVQNTDAKPGDYGSNVC